MQPAHRSGGAGGRVVDLRDRRRPAGGAPVRRRRTAASGSRVRRRGAGESHLEVRQGRGVMRKRLIAWRQAGEVASKAIDVGLAQRVGVGALAACAVPVTSCAARRRPAASAARTPSALRALATSSASQPASCGPWCVSSPNRTSPRPYAGAGQRDHVAHRRRLLRGFRAEVVAPALARRPATGTQPDAGSPPAAPARAARAAPPWVGGSTATCPAPARRAPRRGSGGHPTSRRRRSRCRRAPWRPRCRVRRGRSRGSWLVTISAAALLAL